ncbi:FAGR077Cp [Eremothecium gossypii FDAG1]|nr:FAGR077Cp [Eremothecium gossypii FDAG1]
MSRQVHTGRSSSDDTGAPQWPSRNSVLNDDIEALQAEYDQLKAGEVHSAQGATHGDIGSRQYSGSGKPAAQYLGLNVNSREAVPEYEETVVSVKDYYNYKLRGFISLNTARDYALSVFPLHRWIHHYNVAWMYADMVAGITVGCVLVPQSMSYAQLASLSPQYGLYSSFVGAFIYSFFATSKDVCIGPVAVMSLETAKVIARVTENLPEDTNITGPIIATALTLLCGAIAMVIGILRLGFLVEFISITAVTGFMTGSALSIISGQVPSLMGYSKKVNTRATTYKVIIESLKHLKDTNMNAAFGLVPLVLLFLWKWICGSLGPRLVDRYLQFKPSRASRWNAAFFYLQALRNAVIIVVFTAISWGISRHKLEKPPISLLGKVPSGLKNVGPLELPEGLVEKLLPELPAATIILLLEHIAIAKSFGRINNYKVVPDQELIAIGVTNLFATFFNAYPATGSFSRSALKAKCNVKTPLSGLFTGACVLLALYCLTEAFYFIPKATLSAVIIHAVADLIASYKVTWMFWRTNPLDFFAFIVTVIITVFSSIEHGIYFSISWSCAVLLCKVAFPDGKFLGYIDVAEVIEPAGPPSINSEADLASIDNSATFQQIDKDGGKLNTVESVLPDPHTRFHRRWIPLDHAYSRELNPEAVVNPPPPGVIVYRPTDSWTYLNCSRHFDIILDHVKEHTRPGQLVNHLSNKERLWCDPGPWRPPRIFRRFIADKRTGSAVADARPVLRVLAMDWSQVSQVDSTGIQNLVDLRNALNKYADRPVEFHFAGIVSPWIKRALVNTGFGIADPPLMSSRVSYHLVRLPADPPHIVHGHSVVFALGTNTPFFHLDMPDFETWRHDA